MAAFNPMSFVSVGDGVIAIYYPEILAAMTDTKASDWEYVAGPDTRVGVNYWFVHAANDLTAYVTLDQDQVSLHVTDRDGEVVDDLEFVMGQADGTE